MATSKLTALSLLALTVISCAKEINQESGGLAQHIITAGIATETKAEISSSDKTKVLWSAHEKVDVWASDYGVSYVFTGQNSNAASSATFEGDAPSTLRNWLLVSPQGASSAYDYSSSTVTATLPSVQTAVAGSFDPNAAILAGVGKGATVECKNVYSGIRFKVTSSKIASISLKGNSNERIAGKFTFVFDGSGIPGEFDGTEKVVVLNAPSGSCFSTGKWYYLAFLPTTFNNGFTVTAVSTEGEKATYSVNKKTIFNRSQFRERENADLDSGLGWTAITPSYLNTCYGPANSFIMTPGTSLNVDVRPKMILPGWLRSATVFSGAASPNSCSILWSSPESSISASLDGTTLTINAGTSDARALVAIEKDSDILWSFLVWVSESNPTETVLPGGIRLQEALGKDCVFQWGRKDPLISDAHVDNQGDNGLLYSIRNPRKIIDSGSYSDWYTDTMYNGDPNLWGGNGIKTVWDPCPEGWRVPTVKDFSGLVSGGSYGDAIRHWTASTPMNDQYSYSVYNWNPKTSNTRDSTFPVRCVKE